MSDRKFIAIMLFFFLLLALIIVLIGLFLSSPLVGLDFSDPRPIIGGGGLSVACETIIGM